MSTFLWGTACKMVWNVIKRWILGLLFVCLNLGREAQQRVNPEEEKIPNEWLVYSPDCSSYFYSHMLRDKDAPSGARKEKPKRISDFHWNVGNWHLKKECRWAIYLRHSPVLTISTQFSEAENTRFCLVTFVGKTRICFTPLTPVCTSHFSVEFVICCNWYRFAYFRNSVSKYSNVVGGFCCTTELHSGLTSCRSGMRKISSPFMTQREGTPTVTLL